MIVRVRRHGGSAVQCRGSRADSRGFTLVEVLVTVVVTLVAFVGLATAQVLALRAAGSTLTRSQATALAYDIVDRMRVNRGENGIHVTALGGGYDDATLCNAATRHANDQRPCQFDAVLAFHDDDRVTLDLLAWWQTIDSAKLPDWYAGIKRTDDRFLVAVQWDDGRAEQASAPQRNSCLGPTISGAIQEVCVMTQL
jgi:type IV pilus assembly protein PilV